MSILGGQAGISGHAKIGAGARIGGGSGVFGDLPAGGEYMGWPARPRRETLRRIAMTNRVPKMMERIEKLERRLAELEGDDA